MDEIAAAAGVSKQTIYKHFTDKRLLLYSIVLGITDRAGPIASAVQSMFEEMVDLDAGLTALARRYAAAVLHPEVLQLRRLVVCEAVRFPDLARTYYEQAPKLGLEAVMAGLDQLIAGVPPCRGCHCRGKSFCLPHPRTTDRQGDVSPGGDDR